MSGARGTTARRRLRSLGGRTLRKLGLLPGGMADGLGQDAELLGTTLPHTVMVFFPDTTGSLYQIEQWYATFRAVDRVHRLVVVCRDSRTGAAVRRDSGLDVIVVAHYTTIDDLLSRSHLKVALYVNHNPENFSNLRFNSLVHASLMHGDSDKSVSVSNLTKAYDFSFVAGRAAVERMSAFSTFYDAETRCVVVGRPQVDVQAEARARATRGSGARRTVLYAPTWEGPQPSAAYSSVESHGLRLVETFLTAGWRVIYRPHPLTGAQSSHYGEVDRRIRARVERARGLGGGHRVDVGNDIAESFADADLLVCDVSGVAMDWLPCGRPLIVTVPTSHLVSIAASPLVAVARSVSESEIEELPGLACEEVDLDPGAEARARLVEHYLGDTTPGAATARFVAAVGRLGQIRDAEAARLRSSAT